MPCPHEVDISANLGTYNDGLAYGHPDAARGECAWRKHERTQQYRNAHEEEIGIEELIVGKAEWRSDGDGSIAPLGDAFAFASQHA